MASYTEDYLQFCLEQLSDIQDIMHKKMFGGVGFFKEGKMFAGIMYGKLCLKVDETNQADFEATGMTKFESKKKGKGMPYFEVPIEVLEDKKELAKWGTKSWEIAMGK